jgi:HemY protein
MRLVLRLILVLVVGAFFGGLFFIEPVPIRLAVGSWSVETTSAVAVSLLLVALFVLWVGGRFGGFLFGLPRRWRQWRERRRQRAAERALLRALTALAAGDAKQALKESRRACRLGGETPQAVLLAAQAARLNHDEAAARRLFETLRHMEGGEILGLRGLIQQAEASGDWEEVARLAERAAALWPRAPWVRRERLRLALRRRAWKEALALAGPEDPAAVFALAAAREEATPRRALALARRAFEAGRGFAPAGATYARLLAGRRRWRRALQVLREAWRAAPHPDLTAALAAIVPDSMARWREVRNMVAERPGEGESELALAEAALAAGLFGEARQHAERAVEALGERRALRLLAAIEDRLGVDLPVLQARLKALGEAKPDPVWQCRACGAETPEWAPVCPACAEVASLVWHTAAAPLSLPARQNLPTS